MPKPNFLSVEEIQAQMIRVNHAGEYGAKVIYLGQLRKLTDKKLIDAISNMLAQEERHLGYFNKKIIADKVRPTALLPLWHHFGLALGVISVKFGHDYVVLTTDAIEEVIAQHYQHQLDILKKLKIRPDLQEKIQQFLAEEIEHQEIANHHLGESITFAKTIYKSLVKRICQSAIYLSMRI